VVVLQWLNAHLGCHSQCAYLIYIYKEPKDHYGSSILVTPHVSVNIVKMVFKFLDLIVL